MDNIEVGRPKEKYISYSQMSKIFILYSIFVLFNNFRATNVTPSIEIISVNISILELALSCFSISIFCGVLHYFNTAYTPYSKLRNRIFPKMFPTKGFIFNLQLNFILIGTMLLLGFN